MAGISTARLTRATSQPYTGTMSDREHGGPDPGVAGDRFAEDGAHGLAHRPHREVAAEHAEQQQEGREHRAGLAGLRTSARNLLLPRSSAMLLRAWRCALLATDSREWTRHEPARSRRQGRFSSRAGDRGRCTALAQFHRQCFRKALRRAPGTPAAAREAVIPAQQFVLVAVRGQAAERMHLREPAHPLAVMRTSGTRSTSCARACPAPGSRR